MPVIFYQKNCYNILFFITWIAYISTCVVCLANCFRCLGLGGSDSRHGLLYSNASLLFLQGTGFSIAPTTTKQKTKAPTSRDLIASGFVKTRFTNVHQRLYASVLCTSCFGSTSFDTDEHYGRKEKKSYCIVVAALFQIQKKTFLELKSRTLYTMPNLTMVFLNMLAKKILRIKWIRIVTLDTCKSWLSNYLVSSPFVSFQALLVGSLIIAFTTVVPDAWMLPNHVSL